MNRVALRVGRRRAVAQRRIGAGVRLFAVALAMQLHPSAQAIVTRDDLDDSAFLALGEKYAQTTVRFRREP